jgi:2-polyprenyl-3-methyl-5-hydroxy-6-metoxy-1,4-benzoquinol methylase
VPGAKLFGRSLERMSIGKKGVLNDMQTVLTAERRPALCHETLEQLHVRHPVERTSFIAEMCKGKRVLDIGCLDETALAKQDTEHWLHQRIASVAREVIGIDNSERLEERPLITGFNSRIIKGDGTNPSAAAIDVAEIDVIVAGEFIEHLENPLAFLRDVRMQFPGRE